MLDIVLVATMLALLAIALAFIAACSALEQPETDVHADDRPLRHE